MPIARWASPIASLAYARSGAVNAAAMALTVCAVYCWSACGLRPRRRALRRSLIALTPQQLVGRPRQRLSRRRPRRSWLPSCARRTIHAPAGRRRWGRVWPPRMPFSSARNRSSSCR
jgi:hypothetical protein